MELSNEEIIREDLSNVKKLKESSPDVNLREDLPEIRKLQEDLQKLSPLIRKRDPYNILGNPHCIGGYSDFSNTHPTPIRETKTTIENDDEEAEYSSSGLLSQQHHGQRKLILSEIQFLTKFSKKNSIVIYPGSAPGHHITFLTTLFPKLEWVLIDPAPFDNNLSDKKNITIINDYMTDELCESMKEEFVDKNILLISDIRSIDTQYENDLYNESQVLADMMMQENWVLTLQPDACSLKFRFPFDSIVRKEDGELNEYYKERIREFEALYNIESITDGKYYQYIDGDIMIQAFPPRFSTETRLFAQKPYNFVKYNSISYEKKLAFYNQNTRRQMHLQKKIYLQRNTGLDCCNDCCLETNILEEYVTKNRNVAGRITSGNGIEEIVIDLSIKISKILSRFPGKIELIEKSKKFQDIKHREKAPNKGKIL